MNTHLVRYWVLSYVFIARLFVKAIILIPVKALVLIPEKLLNRKFK